MPASKLAYEQRDDAAVVTLAKPETLKAMSLAMLGGLAEAL
jgi:enoyl-CoA hydratase/carnithine racemase